MAEKGMHEKLTITAYKDPKFDQPSKKPPFTVFVNPEMFSYDYKIKYDDKQAPGTTAKALKFKNIEPRALEFEFLFDNTGILSPAKKKDHFMADLHRFRDLLVEMDGETHRPNYLKIVWGTFVVRCCTVSLNILFKLFKSDGTPIRVVAKASFHEFVEDSLRAARENKQSPDLTHQRTVLPGDTLPMMTHRIYGDSKYYLDVARANGLDDFRRLTIGQTIYFPPLK